MDEAESLCDPTPSHEPEDGLTAIFQLMLKRESIDLRFYRRGTLERRIAGRFQKLLCHSFLEYSERLADDPAESRQLLEYVTIKVSHFFRDPAVFARLREEVLPDLAENGSGQSGLRIWSAGCGHGEEAYSIAILLADMRRKGHEIPDIQVLGTDVDERALEIARLGTYPGHAIAEMPLDLSAEFLVPVQGGLENRFEVSSDLRAGVSFEKHNLLSANSALESPPFDLVLCRNVLIYFERSGQERVFSRLTEGVRVGGYLCLGEAEQPPKSYLPEFETVDRKTRLYRRVKPC